MNIEKILYLVAVAVYGFLSIVLSIVRTLKTSKISSEVKAVLPPIDDGEPIDDKQLNDKQLNDDVQPIDEVQSIDKQDVQKFSIEEVLSIVSELLNRKS